MRGSLGCCLDALRKVGWGKLWVFTARCDKTTLLWCFFVLGCVAHSLWIHTLHSNSVNSMHEVFLMGKMDTYLWFKLFPQPCRMKTGSMIQLCKKKRQKSRTRLKYRKMADWKRINIRSYHVIRWKRFRAIKGAELIDNCAWIEISQPCLFWTCTSLSVSEFHNGYILLTWYYESWLGCSYVYRRVLCFMCFALTAWKPEHPCLNND